MVFFGRRQNGDPRRPLFYLGNVVALVGLLLFLSTFLTAALNFGNFVTLTSGYARRRFARLGGIVLIGLEGR